MLRSRYADASKQTPSHRGKTGISTVVTINSVLGRLALFVAGHVVVLGLVVVLSMSATNAGPEVNADTSVVTGSIRR